MCDGRSSIFDCENAVLAWVGTAFFMEWGVLAETVLLLQCRESIRLNRA